MFYPPVVKVLQGHWTDVGWRWKSLVTCYLFLIFWKYSPLGKRFTYFGWPHSMHESLPHATSIGITTSRYLTCLRLHPDRGAYHILPLARSISSRAPRFSLPRSSGSIRGQTRETVTLRSADEDLQMAATGSVKPKDKEKNHLYQHPAFPKSTF